MSASLLIIDDDVELCALLSDFLKLEGFAVAAVHDGLEAVQHCAAQEYDAIVLDIMLPGMQGLDVLRELRRQGDTPVLMLTARGEETDRILGLELGADDYLPKPFSPRELLARIRAVLRRHGAAPAPESTSTAEAHGLSIDRDRRVAELQGQRVELTAYQFDLLWVLARNAGKVLERGDLNNRVRELRGDPPVEFDPSVDRSIDVHLSKIRAALGSAHETGKDLIETVRGVGYVLGPDR